MRIVTYNIQWGRGRDGRIDLDRIADTIRDADIAALQEVERNWRPQMHSDQVARLAELLPNHHWIFGASVDLNGSRVAPDGRVLNQRRQFGNMILSKLPIISSRVLPLPTLPVNGEINDQSSLLEAVIEQGNVSLRLYNTHLNHLSRRQRLMQIDRLMTFIAEATQRGGLISGANRVGLDVGDEWIVLPDGKLPAMPPSIMLMGDFNMGTDTPEYDAITGPLSPSYGRVTEIDRFADALTLAGLPENEGVTFPGTKPRRLDHCFLSVDLIPRLKSAWIDNAAAGSDHQPVWAEMDL